MITAGHVVVHTTDPEADRAFFRDVLELDSVDAGGGWLIFALPPSEVAFHPAEESGRHELYLITDDLAAATARLADRGVECAEPSEQPWGVLSSFRLPGGGEIGLYEPRHPLAHGG